VTVRPRERTARALAAAATVVLVIALVAGYVRVAAVDSDQFANRATNALRDDSVRSLIAERITDRVVLRSRQDLLAARPIIESVTSAIVGSHAFTNLFRAAVRDVHRAVFDRDRDTVTLTVADVGTVLSAALQKLRPELARKVEPTDRVELLKRDLGSVAGDLARAGDRVRVLALLLLLLALALVAGAMVLSPDRRRTAIQLGTGAVAGGVVLVVAYAVVRSLAVHDVDGPDAQAAAGAVWDAFLDDLRTAAWILAGAGAVVAAAAASLIRPVDMREPLRRVGEWVTTEPRSPRLRVLRGAGRLAAGVLVLVERDAVVQLFLTLAGIFLIYEGVTAMLRVISRPPAPGARRAEVEAAAAAVHRRRRLAVPLLAAALIAGAVALFVGSGGATTAAPARGACNGHRELCARPLAEVALPATHNAMSVPLRGWYSAEQERPIAGQLADGVRGLLLDTHYADRLGNGKLRTYFTSEHALRQQAEQDGVSPDAVDAAKRIRDRLGFGGKGVRGMYLCHTFCELGATPLADVLDDIHDFLVANPDDVLVVINQDYVSPEDFVGATNKAGLGKLVFDGAIGPGRPTLGEMVDSGRRAVFLAENHAGAAPWYQLAYERTTEETPYTFPKVAQLTDRAELPASCKANRGSANAPLFLLNHWISTDPVPRPSDAAKVNAYGPLLARVRECARLRHHKVNLVAVNFYRQGDVFRVVDTLNGVLPRSER
jgi:hypothetical protein